MVLEDTKKISILIVFFKLFLLYVDVEVCEFHGIFSGFLDPPLACPIIDTLIFM